MSNDPPSSPGGPESSSSSEAVHLDLDPGHFRSRLQELFIHEESKDLTLTTGVTSVQVHRAVMFLFTDFFAHLEDKVVLEGFSDRGLDNLVQLLYRGSILADSETRKEVKSLASTLRIRGIIRSTSDVSEVKLGPQTELFVKSDPEQMTPQVENDLSMSIWGKEEAEANNGYDLKLENRKLLDEALKVEITDCEDDLEYEEDGNSETDYEPPTKRKTRSKSVKKLKKTKDSKEIQCEFCSKCYGKPYLVKAHVAKAHGRFLESLICGFCGEGWETPQELLEHEVKGHSEESEGQFQCQLCERRFTGEALRKEHQDVCDGAVIGKDLDLAKHHPCGECSKFYFLTEELKVAHEVICKAQYADKVKSFPCAKCGKKFTTKHQVRGHEAKHRGGEFACKLCGKTFVNAKTHRYHELKHSEGQGMIKCAFCEKTFTNVRRLKAHEMRHGGEGTHNHVCSICGKQFVKSDLLHTHMRVHTGEKPYKCQYCGKGFKQYAHRQTHENLHTGQKSWICATCGRCFASGASLFSHERLHVTKGPILQEKGDVQYKCSLCQTLHSNRVTLEDHYLKEHPDHPNLKEGFAPVGGAGFRVALRDLQCRFCELEFQFESAKLNHERSVHTGEKPFKCDHCDKFFVSKDRRAKHNRYFHKRDRSQRSFKCDLCPKDYVNKEGLKIHMRNHTGERPFQCQHCAKGFTTKNMMECHEKTHYKHVVLLKSV